MTPVPTVIGLVGGIGSGKSAFAQALASRGWAVVDADAIAHALMEDEEVIQHIATAFGHDVLSEDGRVDREALASFAFSNTSSRERLESILHPRIIAQCLEQIQNATSSGQSVVLDAPLLLECELEGCCSNLVFIDAPANIRHARAEKRHGWEPGEAARREELQLPLDEKRRRSHYVVVNAEDLAGLEQEVAGLLKSLSPRND